MTTLAWDGKQLAADSRITFVDEDRYEDNQVVKMVVCERFFYKGLPVRVVGVSGDAEMIGHLTVLADNPEFVIDFAQREYYEVEGFAHYKVLGLILVLDEHVVLVEHHRDVPVQFGEYDRTVRMVVGSSHDAIKHFLFTHLSAKSLVAAGSRKDPNTGGCLSVWEDGQLHTQQKMPRIWKVLWELFTKDSAIVWKAFRTSINKKIFHYFHGDLHVG